MNELLLAVKNYVEVCQIRAPEMEPVMSAIPAVLNLATPATMELKLAHEAVQRAERNVACEKATVKLLEAIHKEESKR